MAVSVKRMKLIAAYHKERDIAYTSHLDVQRTLQRAFRRADLPLAWSNGFNPHPQISFASALRTGYASTCEWFLVELTSPVAPDAFIERVNAQMPQGMRVSDAFAAGEGIGTLSKAVRAARYTATVHWNAPVEADRIRGALDTLLSETEILVNKRTKGGMRQADIRPQIREASLTEAEDTLAVFDLLGALNVDGGLNVDAFFGVLFDRLGQDGILFVRRVCMYFADMPGLPCLPASERNV